MTLGTPQPILIGTNPEVLHEKDMVTGNISLGNEGLGHPPGQPPRPAEVLFVHDWGLEWITGGRRENTFQLLPPGGLPCQGAIVYPLNLPIVSFLLERRPLEFWKSCSPKFYKAVDLAQKGWIIMDVIMHCP